MKDDQTTSNEVVEHSKDNEEISRRKFIKKVAYTAPTLITLGYLSKAELVHADGTGGPDGPPDGFGGWTP